MLTPGGFLLWRQRKYPLKEEKKNHLQQYGGTFLNAKKKTIAINRIIYYHRMQILSLYRVIY